MNGAAASAAGAAERFVAAKARLDRMDHCPGGEVFPHETLPWIGFVDRAKAATRGMIPVYRVAAK